MKRRPITPLVKEKAGVPRGGTAGQFLVKASATHFDTSWGITATQVNKLAANPPFGTVMAITDGGGGMAWGDVIAGSGATPYLVWWNGTDWTVLGK